MSLLQMKKNILSSEKIGKKIAWKKCKLRLARRDQNPLNQLQNQQQSWQFGALKQ